MSAKNEFLKLPPFVVDGNAPICLEFDWAVEVLAMVDAKALEMSPWFLIMGFKLSDKGFGLKSF